ncbi:MAG TPA: GTPase HflX [Spirochaetota bacterium]
MIREMKAQRAILAAVRFPHISDDDFENSLAELKELSSTAGFMVVGTVTQNRSEPDVSCYIGKGKLDETRAEFESKADVIIFNHELSPSQIRNVERATNLRALTRTEIILDIFVIHAKTRASKLQVEMASLSYQMPRIIGKGVEMSRIEGGIGMKGPGEQQLELDRRKIRTRIAAIRKELKHVSSERENQRKRRRSGDRKVAIVGYTNSGKSTLLNRLTKEKVMTENKLFVTLDTTTRKFWLGGREYATVTDTVGFIRDIPHGLIESFQSTFEDALMSDLLLHVVDISARDFEEKRRVAEDALRDMEPHAIPTVLVFNKIDCVPDEEIRRVKGLYPDALFISAREKTGVEELREKVRTLISKEIVQTVAEE